MISAVYSKTKLMHINLENLVELFYSESRLFDFEGKLFVRLENNKQSTANYQECLCRLRGNLLLIGQIISSPKANTSHLAISLVILNKFEIKLCEEAKHYEFCIHLNKSANFEKYYFICNTNTERDKWIQSIYLASFDFLKSVQRALKDKLNEKQENEIKLKSCNQIVTIQASPTLQPNRFLLVKCDSLLLSSAIDLFVFVKVYYRKLYLDQRWTYLASTELIQSQSPQFSSRINLPSHPLIELKFELFKVIEPELDTSFLAAFAYFLISSTNKCPSHYQVPLVGLDHNQPIGLLLFSLIIESRSQIRKSISLVELATTNKSLGSSKFFKVFKRSSSSFDMNLETETQHNRQAGTANFDIFFNTLHKKFSFHVLPDRSDLTIEEFMSESKFVFLIPQILM